MTMGDLDTAAVAELSAKVSSIKKRLKDLNDRQAYHFDPMRYAVIKNLAKRLDNSLHVNNEVLIDKTETALCDYVKTLADHQRRAQKTLKKLIIDFPGCAEAAQKLFEQCKFRQLEKLRAQLLVKQTRDYSVAVLSNLSKVMNSRAQSGDAQEKPLSITTLLYQQEEQAWRLSNAADIIGDEESHFELQSVRLFRESVRHEKIDKIIAEAISVSPENPGPYNSHMLAIKAMTRMHDLSPQYLRRLSGYIETLLWLDRNSNKVDDSKSIASK